MIIENHSHVFSAPAASTPLDNQARDWRQDASLEKQWGRRRTDLKCCPDSRQVFVDSTTGEVGGQSWCKRNTCLFCVRVRAVQYHRAIRLAAPSQMIGLTRLSGIWQEDRETVKQMLRSLRRTDGLTIACAWAVEPNPNKGTGFHAHGWLWGSHLTHERLAYRARRAGLGVKSYVAPVRYHGNYAYLMKNATHNEASLAEHLHLNGAEPIHARHFWRDAVTGEKLTRDQAVQRSSPRRVTRSGVWGLAPAAALGAAS